MSTSTTGATSAWDAEAGLREMTRTWFAATSPLTLARRYLAALPVLLLIGVAAALAMRFVILRTGDDALSPTAYGRLFSLHGILLIYFVLAPAFPAVIGNVLIPRLAGGPHLAFPRLGAAAWHLFAAGAALALIGALSGGIAAGWSFLAPAADSAGPFVTTAAGVLLGCLSMLLNSVNQVATLDAWRRAGRRWFDLPLTAIGLHAAGLCAALALPWLALSLVLGIVENLTGAGVLSAAAGADPMIGRRLFWLFATPATFMIILPALGAVSDEIARQACRPPRDRRVAGGSLYAIAALGFLLSGRHVMGMGGAPVADLMASLLNHVAAAPLLLVAAGWLFALRGGFKSVEAATLYALGVPLLAVAGILSGLALATPGPQSLLHNTLFVVGHAHLLLVGGALLAFLAALHGRWPELAGRAGDRPLARVAAWLCGAGILLSFVPMLALGSAGVLRRQSAMLPEHAAGQTFATAGTTILVAGLVLAVLSLATAPRAAARE